MHFFFIYIFEPNSLSRQIKMKKKIEQEFSEFFGKWVYQLDDYLQQLRTISSTNGGTDQQELQALVSKVTQHYKEYYTIKWSLAHEDVLAFFYPIWRTPLENACSWVTGWKPSAVFKLLDDSETKTRVFGPRLGELTQEQVRKIEQLRVKIRMEEQKVEREMERQQVAVADRKMVELARLVSRVKMEGVSKVEGVVEIALVGVLGGLENVMKSGDCVRLKTLKGILDVLNPLQCIDFLAGISMLQIQLTQLGKQRDFFHHL